MKQQHIQIQNTSVTFSKLQSEPPLINVLSDIHRQRQNNLSTPTPQRYSQNLKANIQVNVVTQKPYRIKLLEFIPSHLTQAQKKAQDQRIYRVFQLIDTEKNFVRDLSNVLEHIRRPLKNFQLLSENEQKLIFSNLQQIYQLNSQFYTEMNKKWEKYDYNQLFGDVLLKYSPFFKIYSTYISAYQKGFSQLLKLRAAKSEANIIIKNFEQMIAAKDKKCLRDYFIAPFQRFTKYKNLIQIIIKRTNKNHPDYDNLKKAEIKFGENVQKINTMTDAMIKANKINSIDFKFGTQKQSINIKGRTYLFQQKVYWLKNQQQIPVLAYFFNDLILFIDQIQQKIILRLIWNQKCFVQNMKQGKNIRNAIYIAAENNTAIISPIPKQGLDQNSRLIDMKTSKNRILQNINQQIIQPYKKLAIRSTQVKVIILGNQQMNSTTISKHTIYILQLKVDSFKQMLFIRYSWLLDFAAKIKKKYASLANLDIQNLQKRFLNHTTKIIQFRGIKIQDILQKILNNQDVMKDPAFVIKQLGLKKNFYQISLILNRKQFKIKRLQSKQKQELTTYQILVQVQRRLGRYVNQQELIQLDGNYIIDIKLPNGKLQRMRINQTTTVEDLCKMLAHKLNLKVNIDFRLFNQATKKQCRVLDYDCIIAKLFNLKPQKQSQTFLQTMKSSIMQIFNEGKPNFIFKKYYYLPDNKQMLQYKLDLVRLQMIGSQLYQQVLQGKYKLVFKQYCFIFGLIIYTKNIQTLNNQSDDIIIGIIPEIIYKKQKIEIWKQQIQKSLKKIKAQVEGIINQNKLLQDKISQENKKFYLQKIPLSYQLGINFLKNNQLFGANLFYIQINQQIFHNLKTKNDKASHNLYLSIHNKGLELFTSSKISIMKFPYKQIIRKQFYPNSIMIELSSQRGNNYIFNTSQSFEISKLIEYYKVLNQTIQQFKIN